MTTISLKLYIVFVSSGCVPFCVREKNVFMPGYIYVYNSACACVYMKHVHI